MNAEFWIFALVLGPISLGALALFVAMARNIWKRQ